MRQWTQRHIEDLVKKHIQIKPPKVVNDYFNGDDWNWWDFYYLPQGSIDLRNFLKERFGGVDPNSDYEAPLTPDGRYI